METLVTLTKADGTDVGEYPITGERKNANYNVIVESEGTYTINPRPLTVQISKSLTKVYDGFAPDSATFTYTVTDGVGTKTYNTLPEGTISYTVANSSANVGTYTVTGQITVTGESNYTYTILDGKFTIANSKGNILFGDGKLTIQNCVGVVCFTIN